jgi:mono/diheme cytochrome c family protein
LKRILGLAMAVMCLGAASLLAQSLEGKESGRGKTLYQNKCQFCHGIRGDGKGPAAEPLLGHPVDFTNSKFWQDDVEKIIEDTIKKGKEMMPAFDLNPDEIKAIIQYVSQTFKKSAQNNNGMRNDK